MEEDLDWEDRLDAWEIELELGAQLEGSDWVTLERAATETGVSRAALRSWYRSGQIPSRLVDGPHGQQRLVPLATVAKFTSWSRQTIASLGPLAVVGTFTVRLAQWVTLLQAPLTTAQ